MFTRCPECATVHPVNAALLAQGGGRYRCGKCNKTSNALENLFDDWPAAGQKPPGAGDLPVLGLSIDLEEASRSRLEPKGAGLTGDAPEPKPRGRSWLRAAWITAALVLATVIVFQLAALNGTPILERADIEDAMVRIGLREPPREKSFRDVGQISLVNRYLVSHPTDAGMLRLHATIVNRARRRQPYPDVEVTLFDAAGERLDTHRFAPEDYLAPDADLGRGMSPQAYVPLSLDFEDPGDVAVGFEIDFR